MYNLTIDTKYSFRIIIKEITFYCCKIWCEINKNATSTFKQPHIIKQLSPMTIYQFFDSLTLYDDVIFTQKI